MTDDTEQPSEDELTATEADLAKPEEPSAGEPTTTLVEVSPGVVAVVGDVPDGLDRIDLDLLPAIDREKLSTTVGAIANAATVSADLAQAGAGIQGLYRVNEATMSMLNSGAQLASKDGAHLGAMFQNGQIVGQARFIPISMTSAAAVAAIGPAVAMAALQMQIAEVSGLIRENIALTAQTLKTIRNEQWSELEGLTETVDAALTEAREVGSVTESVWETVAAHGSDLRKQLKLYRKNVADHVREINRLDPHERRRYLETNAEAIVFDTYALLDSLKAYGGYQTLRAARARVRSIDDEDEAQVFERITETTPDEIEASLNEISSLVDSLVRELRIIAELPGRATRPLSKKRKATKQAQLTSAQVLEAISPLADKLRPPVAMPESPDVVCAPEALDAEPYLRILRWFLEPDEELRAIAFCYRPGDHNLAGVIPSALGKRVDSTWSALTSTRGAAALDRVAPGTLVAVTDRRIITADPRKLRRLGELDDTYTFDKIRHVRTPEYQINSVRPTIGIATDHADLDWMFPFEAGVYQVLALASLIERSASTHAPSPPAIETSGGEAPKATSPDPDSQR